MNTILEQPTSTCPKCNGTGRISFPVLIEGEESIFESGCLVCKKTGRVTLGKYNLLLEETNKWCSCNNTTGNTLYFVEGEDCENQQAHWKCVDCGKLITV